MLITRADAMVPAFRLPPGTPVVGLSAKGEPVAVGLRLSAEPAARQAELTHFAGLLVDHADKVGDVATMLSSMTDIAADLKPGWTQQAAVGGDVVALFATGVSVAAAAKTKDNAKIAIESLQFGANALNLLSDSGLLGANPTLHTVALFAKGASSIASVVYSPPPKPKP